jgi:hypothetical protein
MWRGVVDWGLILSLPLSVVLSLSLAGYWNGWQPPLADADTRFAVYIGSHVLYFRGLFAAATRARRR